MEENEFEGLNLVTPPEHAPPINDRLTQQEQDHLFDQRNRDHQVKTLFHNLLIWSMRICFFVVIMVFLIRVSHFVMPQRWAWLKAEDLQTIDKFFFSGALGGILSRHLNKIVR
jgi:hypothetical protein